MITDVLISGAGEMAQQLCALAALATDVRSHALLWPPWTLHTCDAHTHMHAGEMPIHKIKISE